MAGNDVKPSGPIWDRAVQENNWGLFAGFWDEDKRKYAKRPATLAGRGPVDVKKAFVHDLAAVRTAFRALLNSSTPYWIGYLPRKGSALIGLGFDHVVDPETGEVTAEWAREAVEAGETYTELSPSGDGVRMLIERKSTDAMFSGESNDGGFFSTDAKGFTLTGKSIGATGEISIAPKARQAILGRRGAGAGRTGRTDRRKKPDEQVAPEGQEHLAYEALAKIPPTAEHGFWRDVMYAFSAAVGFSDEAWEAFDEWSAKGDGYNAEDNRAQWDRMQKNPSHSFGFDSLLRWAEEGLDAEIQSLQRRYSEMDESEVLTLFQGTAKAEINKRAWGNLTEEDWKVVFVMVVNKLPIKMRKDAEEYLRKKWSAEEDQAHG